MKKYSWSYLFLLLALFVFGHISTAFARTQIYMQAFDDKKQALPDSVPLYYDIAHSAQSNNQVVPIFAKHRGKELVSFDEDSGVDSQSYIGIYLPIGYSAKYRFRLAARANGLCAEATFGDTDPWIIYDTSRPSAQALQALQLGQGGLPPLPDGGCLYGQWQIAKDQSYRGNTANFYEQPFAALNGIVNMPATQELVGQGVGPDAATIDFTVAGNLGNVGRILRINTGNRPPISVLHNLGAPTDDGMVWGIAVKDATNMYEPGPGAPDKIDFGASQFCGHPDSNTIFGGIQWGMEMPLIRVGQTLTMDDSKCNGGPCYVPMYTDFTNATPQSRSGTMPFVLPRSAHPFDGRVEEISVKNVPRSGGAPGPVEKLTILFKYHPHLPFTATEVNPHLWLSLATTEVNPDFMGRGPEPQLPVETYVVRDDGTTGKLAWGDLANADPEQNSTSWGGFCGDKTNIHCENNPRQQNRYMCSCFYVSNKATIKRLVINYVGKNVALSVAPLGNTFGKLIYNRNYNPAGRPAVLISASSNYFVAKDMNKPALQYTPAEDATDGYFMYVGTLQDLTDACVGTKDC